MQLTSSAGQSIDIYIYVGGQRRLKAPAYMKAPDLYYNLKKNYINQMNRVKFQ